MPDLISILVPRATERRADRRSAARAEARAARAERDLARLQAAVAQHLDAPGLDGAIQAVRDAADRLQAVNTELASLREADSAHRSAHQVLVRRIAEIAQAHNLPHPDDPDSVLQALARQADQGRALDLLRAELRPRTKTVEAFARYISANADDPEKLRRYLGFPVTDSTTDAEA